MDSTDSKRTVHSLTGIPQVDLDRLIDVCRLLAEHGITPVSVQLVTRLRCVTVQLDCRHDVDVVADALGVRRSDGLPSSYVRGEYDDPVRVYGPAECEWHSRCRSEAVSS